MCDKSYLSIAFASVWVQLNSVFSAFDVKRSRALVVRGPLDALDCVLQEIWTDDLAVGARGEVSSVALDVIVAEECLGPNSIGKVLA